MRTKISVKIQGVRGGNPTYEENKGYVCTIIDGKENGSITIDAFEGKGPSYTRREIPLITVFHGGTLIFEGTFSEFIIKLK